jgi:oligopeptide transport system substrate-binding protein
MSALRTALAVALASGALAACSQGDNAALRPPCPAGKLCLEYGNTAEPATLDPQKYNGEWEQNIIMEMMIGLTASDQHGRTIPGLATHWETSADNLTWTFHLRDADWSDGLPVTADDFVAGFQRLFDPKVAAPQASQFYAIKNSLPITAGKMPLSALGVRAIDARTLEIKLEQPWPVMLEFLNGPATVPAPRQAVSKWGDAWVQPGRYVSNGPYLLKTWALGDRVTIEKNPRYFEADKVCFDRVNFYPTTDTVSAERRVRSGELDLNTNVVSNRVARLRQPGQMPGYVHTDQYAGLLFLVFNLRDVPELRDVRVRQAISMAIDRDFIANKLLRGGQIPATSYVPPGMVDYDNKAKVYWADWPLERRQAEARRLMAAAGYKPGHKLKLEFKYRNSADPVAYLPSIQADMKAIGVEAELVVNETQVAYAAYDVRDFEVGEAGWGGGIDAYGFLYLFRKDTGSQNNSGYDNPKFDAILDQAKGEVDFKKRSALFAQAEQMILDDAPIAPIYFLADRNLVNPNITGWSGNIVNIHRVRFMCLKDAEARRAGKVR